MKFIMVMIICFGGDCDAVFDPAVYFETYNNCYETAIYTTELMREMYPESSGEIHCWNQDEMQIFQQWLKDGNKPSLMRPESVQPLIDA